MEDKLTLEQCIDWMLLEKGNNIICTHDGRYCINPTGALMLFGRHNTWWAVNNFFVDFIKDIRNDTPIVSKINE